MVKNNANGNGIIKCLQVVAGLLLFSVLLRALFSGMEKYTHGDKVTVYGRMSCPWTKKQVDHLDGKNMKYDFVDCEAHPDKCSAIKAHPTIKMPDGTMEEGFKKL